MSDNQVNQWEKEETVEVSSRSWFGFKSEMDKTIAKYEKEGWTLIQKEQIGSKKRFNIHFGYKEKTILEKASRYRYVFYVLGSMILCSVIFYGFLVYVQNDLKNIYYVTSNNINVRENPNTNSAIIGNLEFREDVRVRDTVEGGFVSGNNEWYEIRLSGDTGYVHSSLLNKNRPPAPVTAVPAQPTNPPNIAPIQQQPTNPPAPPQNNQSRPESQWDCNLYYTCGSFSSCGQVNSFLNSCPGDRGRMDRDGDGVACESLCG